MRMVTTLACAVVSASIWVTPVVVAGEATQQTESAPVSGNILDRLDSYGLPPPNTVIAVPRNVPNEQIPPAVAAALIAAISALAGVFVNSYFTWQTFRRQNEIERFKVELQTEFAEKDAWKSYRFDAKKRLYSECEPIFFQMSEAAIDGLSVCRRLSEPDFWDKLSLERQDLPDASSWMMSKSSALIFIIYEMIRPLALFCILREKINSVDLSLDPATSYRYDLARELFGCLCLDKEVAHIPPVIDYDPQAQGWRNLRLENPAKYWWQGLSAGRLDNAVRSILVSDCGVTRIMTFGEFEELYLSTYHGTDKNSQKKLGVFSNALYGFSAESRPVFCRIIMIKAHIYHALSQDVPEIILEIRHDRKALSELLKLPAAIQRELHHLNIIAGCKPDTFDSILLPYIVERLLIGQIAK